MPKEVRFIVVVGSLMSGLGKGITSASIGRILQGQGIKAVPIKFDGYLNVDCGTMNPFRHGEVFVLDDGTECDMDLGTYERFLNFDLKSENSMTGGKLFRYVIDKERKGGYLGYDVQIVPHLTNEIKRWVKKVGEDRDADVVLIEVGGTVGDLENGYFLEAMRQLALEEKVAFVQVTYVPTMDAVGEQKTKPTQHATRLLASLGIQPDVIVCREGEKLKQEAKKKISLFCNVPEEAIIDNPDVATIYEVPELFEKQGLGKLLMDKLDLKSRGRDMVEWTKLVEKIGKPRTEITIGITGKYTALKDSYVSIKEALVHAGAKLGCRASLKWIETTDIEEGKLKADDALKDCQGIIVPGGFGARGTEGKIECIRHARYHGVPYLGLCLGMQLAVVEYARNVCSLKNANSTEMDEKTENPVIDILPEQKTVTEKGATMRLGGQDVEIKEGTNAHKIYGALTARERFRHRYEVNPDYIERFEAGGLIFSGKAPKSNIMQVMELPGHAFFMGTQFHPELSSRLERPHPLFVAFVEAAMKMKK
ncbi:CTP synthase [Candidatus Burarchaeum australiense]|nr:CTP synthase [Candidatus Burarchaeum australiense]